jgi:hypothetical protein
MLKIQELQIDGTTFFVREPRVRDYMIARKAPEDEYTYALMGQMVLDQNHQAIGHEGILELPLRAFDQLNDAVNALTSQVVKKDDAADPLTPSDGSSTG